MKFGPVTLEEARGAIMAHSQRVGERMIRKGSLLDEGAVVAALDQILGNEFLARQMGEAARRRVNDYFAMDKYIVRVLSNYRRAIECSRKKLDALKAAETAGAA